MRPRGHDPRLPQAHHDRRRRREHPRGSDLQVRHRTRHPPRRARRSGHAHRSGRRRRLLEHVGKRRGGARFRLGAAREPRDAAPLPGGDRPLLAARGGQPDPVHPRRGRGRAVQRAARARRRRRAGRDVRPPGHPLRRPGDVAARDLVQRVPGALRPRDRPRPRRRLRRAVRARALPVGGCRGSDAEPAPGGTRHPFRCDPGLDADARPARRPPAHAPSRRPRTPGARHVRHAADQDRPGDRTGAARAGGRGQVVPRHHRRSHRRRARRPRPDGGTVAGTGGRLRGHARRLRHLYRRGDGDGRAHAAGATGRARRGQNGGGRGAHQHRLGGRCGHRSGSAVGELDGRVRSAG